jgi:serine/threonine protein kinase
MSCANCGQDLSDSTRPSPDDFSGLQRKLRQTGRDWSRPATLQPGDVVGQRYEVVDVIGSAVLGVVYQALDQEVEIPVALKIIADEFLPDQEARDRFVQALDPARDLVHENLVRFFEVGEDRGRCFYVTQLLEGLTLRKVMQLRREKGQRFSLNEVEPIFVQLCRALGATHEGMPHGGLKPENIIILPDLLKITDFGLPQAVPRAAYLTAQREAGEAFRYLAPEIRAKRTYGARADVYSVAAILVELLTGEPHEEGVSSLGGIEDVPQGFETILSRALSEDPEHRQAHAGELGEDLTEALTGRTMRVVASDPSVPSAGAFSSVTDGVPTSGASAGSQSVDFSDPSVPAVPEKGSGVTHELDVDEIEFASQRARLGEVGPRGADAEDDFLRAPPPAAEGERTEQISVEELVQRREASRREEMPPPSSGGTERIEADMILQASDEAEEEESQNTGRLFLAPAAQIAEEQRRAHATAAAGGAPGESLGIPLKSREEAEREARETRARDALQAFDFDATLQDTVDSAARSPHASSSPVGEDLGPEPEPADAPDPALVPVLPSADASPAAEPHHRARVQTPPRHLAIAPEVLSRDAVPAPFGSAVDVTMAVPRPVPGPPEFRVIPAAVVVFIALLVAGTAGYIYHINRARSEFARQELERKRIESLDLMGKQVKAPESPPLAVATPTSQGAAPPAPAGSPDQGRPPATAREPDHEAGVSPTSPEPPLSRRVPGPASKPGHTPPVKVDRRPVVRPEPRTKPEPNAALGPKPTGKGGAPAGNKKGTGGAERSCPRGMQLIPGRGAEDGTCIDRYEYPGKGRVPAHGVSLAMARSSCKARGQRLCTAKEWLRSCASLFPYGKTYDPAQCNTGGKTPLPAGARKGCRSRFGVHDLSGNVSEWVEDGVAMGGDATSEQGHASCPARSAGNRMTGFRCCGDLEWE